MHGEVLLPIAVRIGTSVTLVYAMKVEELVYNEIVIQ